MNIEELELKYIKLLLERCLNIKKSDSLFISYDTENQKFIDKLVEYAKEMGYKDIYLDGTDHNYKHDVLKQITLEEIDSNPLFLKGKWDEYAKKEANFLLLVTEVPGLMEHIDKDKLARVNYLARSSKPIYCEKQAFNLIPWCIAALPGKDWADKLFPNSENAYLELEKYILQMCMIDTEEPVNSWNDYLNEQKHKPVQGTYR